MAGKADMNEFFGDGLLGVLMPDDSAVLFFVRDLDNDDEFEIVTSTNPCNGLYLTALLSKQYSTRLKYGSVMISSISGFKLAQCNLISTFPPAFCSIDFTASNVSARIDGRCCATCVDDSISLVSNDVEKLKSSTIPRMAPMRYNKIR